MVSAQHKFVQMQALLEMSRRHLESTLTRGNAFTDAATTRLYLHRQLRHFGHEVFACLFLDTRHRLISFEPLFRGKIDGASVYPREVVKQALKHNAAAVIFAHNHPSGVAEPSQSEIQLTRQLPRALELVDIRVLDHIIIGDGDTTSLAEMGHC